MLKELNSHLPLAHHLWKQQVRKGDSVIDASCGNGYDSLYLAELVLEEGRGNLLLIDRQEQAIENTKKRLSQLPAAHKKRIVYQHGCHSSLPQELSPQLIVYNLGYLPGGDKSLTSETKTTLASLTEALRILSPQGAISMTIYPGHAAGYEEQQALLNFCQELDSSWNCLWYHWCKRHRSPQVCWIQKYF